MEPSDNKKRKIDGETSTSTPQIEPPLPYSTEPESPLPISLEPESIPGSPRPPSPGSEPQSNPPTPPAPRMIGEGDDEYELEKEFDYGEYMFESEKDGSNFPVLSPVSDSTLEPGGGLCSYYATIDVCETRTKILEATLPPQESRYFDNFFGDRLSVEHLVDTGLDYKLSGLLKHMTRVGVTSMKEYDGLPRDEMGPKLKDVSGCRKFTIDSWERVWGRKLHVTVEDIEGGKGSDEDDDNVDGLLTTEIRKYGPVIGVYEATNDNHMLCEQPIYDQTKDSTPMYDCRTGLRLGHAVMLTGYGIARNVRTNKRVVYYVLQNNSGKQHNNKGRILAEILLTAWVPIFARQCNLEEFRRRGGIGPMKMIPKEFLGPQVIYEDPI